MQIKRTLNEENPYQHSITGLEKKGRKEKRNKKKNTSLLYTKAHGTNVSPNTYCILHTPRVNVEPAAMQGSFSVKSEDLVRQ
jgi:hypothetical protein